MQTANLAFIINQATDKRQRAPIAKAVRDAVEVGVVVPSILRSNLEAAGYIVKSDHASLAEYGFRSTKTLARVLVVDGKNTIVAMGAAGDHAEALLAAMLGWFRENPLEGAEPPAGFGVAPVQG